MDDMVLILNKDFFFFFEKNSYRILNNKFKPNHYSWDSNWAAIQLMFNGKKEDEPNGIKPDHDSNLKTMNDLQSLQRDNE